MAIELSPGLQLASTVCETQVVVVRPPQREVEITCGGAPMVLVADAAEPAGSPAPDAAEGTLLGKRYVNEAEDLEVLCTRPGDGSLAADGEALSLKAAKPLPSSD